MLGSKMFLLWCLCFCLVRSENVQPKPNIVLFIADDLGWSDVGYHGSNVIPTPNIDALAYSGLALHNYYVAPICTPSRAALMTGKYPIHTGMQHGVIYGTEKRGLPLSEKILPQYLKELGYKTHLVGKWHLGHYKKEYLPLNRGFDSHLGFWTGKIDMVDHTNMERGTWGYDFRRGFKVAYDLFGQYATDVYTDEAVNVIRAHNKTEPIFLMVAHSAVHSGNPNEPIRAPDKEINKFNHIENFQRRKFAAVVSQMDESIGRVINTLQAEGLLENSIILFSTDNGGPAAGFNDNAASNFPLKGVKNTLWEGGVRGAGLLWSPLLEKKSRVATQRLHIVDWLPTLLGAAGYDTSSLKSIDGINQWEALSKDLKSERTTLVHNIDDILISASITVDKWKLIQGVPAYNGTWDHWYGPGERDGVYNLDLVYKEETATVLQKLGLMPNRTVVAELREASTLKCNESLPKSPPATLQGPYQLYNIEEDPCEYRNLVDQEPEILQKLIIELERVNATAVAPNAQPLDPKGDPKYWGRVYTNFGDYERQHGSAICS